MGLRLSRLRLRITFSPWGAQPVVFLAFTIRETVAMGPYCSSTSRQLSKMAGRRFS